MPDESLPASDIRARLHAAIDDLKRLNADSQVASAVVELDQTRVGRLSRMDAMQGQAMSQEARRRRELALRAAQAALKRLDAGEYGDCVVCGEQISAGRLDMDPSIATCIGCAAEAEQN